MIESKIYVVNLEKREVPNKHSEQAVNAIKKIWEWFFVFTVKAMVSFCAGWLVSLWTIPKAYSERGYYAVGGEWILILLTGVTAYWIVDRQMDIQIKRKETYKNE